MATALDIIKRAMRLIGAYQIGETPSSDESQDGLTALNAMLSGFANERMMLYAVTQEDVPLVSGQSEYTIGPTGDIVTVRPVYIDVGTYLQLGAISYPVTVSNLQQYASVPQKGMTDPTPWMVWYRPDYPDGTLFIYPEASDSSAVLKLASWKPLTGFSTLTSTITLPPGYEDMLAYNLAVRLAPEYQMPVTDAVASVARTTKKQLKNTNTVVPVLGMPVDLLPYPNRTSYNYL